MLTTRTRLPWEEEIVPPPIQPQLVPAQQMQLIPGVSPQQMKLVAGVSPQQMQVIPAGAPQQMQQFTTAAPLQEQQYTAPPPWAAVPAGVNDPYRMFPHQYENVITMATNELSSRLMKQIFKKLRIKFTPEEEQKLSFHISNAPLLDNYISKKHISAEYIPWQNPEALQSKLYFEQLKKHAEVLKQANHLIRVDSTRYLPGTALPPQSRSLPNIYENYIDILNAATMQLVAKVRGDEIKQNSLMNEQTWRDFMTYLPEIQSAEVLYNSMISFETYKQLYTLLWNNYPTLKEDLQINFSIPEKYFNYDQEYLSDATPVVEMEDLLQIVSYPKDKLDTLKRKFAEYIAILKLTGDYTKGFENPRGYINYLNFLFNYTDVLQFQQHPVLLGTKVQDSMSIFKLLHENASEAAAFLNFTKDFMESVKNLKEEVVNQTTHVIQENQIYEAWANTYYDMIRKKGAEVLLQPGVPNMKALNTILLSLQPGDVMQIGDWRKLEGFLALPAPQQQTVITQFADEIAQAQRQQEDTKRAHDTLMQLKEQYIQQLAGSYQEQQQQLNELQIAYNTSQDQLAAAAAVVSTFQTQVATLAIQHSEHQAQLEYIHQQTAASEQEIKKLQDQLSEEQQQKDEKERMLNKAKAQRDKQKKENESLKKQIETLMLKQNEMSKTAKSYVDKMVKEHDDYRQQKEEQLNALKSVYASLNQSYQNTQNLLKGTTVTELLESQRTLTQEQQQLKAEYTKVVQANQYLEQVRIKGLQDELERQQKAISQALASKANFDEIIAAKESLIAKKQQELEEALQSLKKQKISLEETNLEKAEIVKRNAELEKQIQDAKKKGEENIDLQRKTLERLQKTKDEETKELLKRHEEQEKKAKAEAERAAEKQKIEMQREREKLEEKAQKLKRERERQQERELEQQRREQQLKEMAMKPVEKKVEITEAKQPTEKESSQAKKAILSLDTKLADPGACKHKPPQFSPFAENYTPIDEDNVKENMRYAFREHEVRKTMKEFLISHGFTESNALVKVLSKQDVTEKEAAWMCDFVLWLAGRANKDDKNKTPWLKNVEKWNPRLVIKGNDVRDFLYMIIDAKYRFKEQLKWINFNFSGGLKDAYLYFKYIVRGAGSKGEYEEQVLQDWFGDYEDLFNKVEKL